MPYDLTDLRLFLAIVETGTLSAGAARIHLAPSSASHRLQQLEQSLGVTLLERHARGMRPTPAGEILVAGARAVVARLEQMHGDLAPYAEGLRTQIVVHANTNAINAFLPDDLGEFLRLRPQLRISLVEASSPEVQRAVAAGEAEVGVIAGEASSPALQFLPYRQDRLVLVVPPGHPLGARAHLGFAEAARQPLVMLHAGSAIHTFMQNMAADRGLRLDVRIQVRSFPAILRMVGAGVGCGVVPHSAVAQHQGPRPFAELALDEDWAQRDLRLCVQDAARLSPQARALVEHLSSATARTRPGKVPGP